MDKPILVIVDYPDLLYQSYLGKTTHKWEPIMKTLENLRMCSQKIRQTDGSSPINFIFVTGGYKVNLDGVEMTTLLTYPAGMCGSQFAIFSNMMKHVLIHMSLGYIYVERKKTKDVIASMVASLTNVCKCATPCKICKHREARKYKKIIIFSRNDVYTGLLNYEDCVLYKAPGLFYSKEAHSDKNEKLFNFKFKVSWEESPIHISSDKGIRAKALDVYRDERAVEDILLYERRFEATTNTL